MCPAPESAPPWDRKGLPGLLIGSRKQLLAGHEVASQKTARANVAVIADTDAPVGRRSRRAAKGGGLRRSWRLHSHPPRRWRCRRCAAAGAGGHQAAGGQDETKHGRACGPAADRHSFMVARADLCGNVGLHLYGLTGER